MALFTVRDRIAIAILAVIILAGWGTRLYLRHGSEDPVRVIGGAAAPPAPAVAPPSLPDSTAASAPSDLYPVDINRASAAELERLPMIGPSRAEAVIRYRVEHGPFAQPADIMKVTGIGPGIYSRIEKLITAKGGGNKE